MLLHDLGAHFRQPDVYQLLIDLSPKQLAYWAAYFQLKPPVADRLDIYLPKLFADLMNMWRSQDSEPITFDELHIDWQTEPPEAVDLTAAHVAAEQRMADAILAAFG